MNGFMSRRFVYCAAWLLVTGVSGGCGLMNDSKPLAEMGNVVIPSEVPKKASPPPSGKKIDILFVVDSNPALMDLYLKNVKNSFKGFTGILSAAADWKIAFTMADYNPSLPAGYSARQLSGGHFMPLELNGEVTLDHVLHSDSENKDQIFLDTLKRYEVGDVVGKNKDPCELPPYCQSHIRNPVQSLEAAINLNPGFFRYDARAVAVILTNGDESSLPKQALPEHSGLIEGEMQHKSQNALADKLQSTFSQHYGAYRKIQVFAISVIPGDAQCLSHVVANRNLPGITYGLNIYRVVVATEGRMMSICESSYSALASAIIHAE